MPVRHLKLILLVLLPIVGHTAQPNIVIILADDLGWGDVGYHGSVISTPSIDALAGQGVVLERYYAQPTCSPTRAALMTGQSSLRNGVLQPIDKNMQGSLPLERSLLPQYFRAAGYQTWLVGKWHLGHAYRAQLPMSRGFDHAYGNLLGGVGYWDHVHGGGVDWHRNGEAQIEDGYATHLLTEEALNLVREREPDRPFLLYLSYTAPHLPNEAPPETVKRYANIADGPRRVHAAMVDEMDRGIGQLVATLEDQGVRDNTLIWFMSDNGGLVKGAPAPALEWLLELLAELFDPPYPVAALEFVRSNAEEGGSDNGPYRMGKGSVYEGGVLVPSLINWPGKLPQSVLDNRVTVVDVLPTLLQAAGISAEKTIFDGAGQWLMINGRDTVLAPDYVTRGYDGSEAYYRGDWKLVASSGGDLELYDLAMDPTESNDLAPQHPAKASELYALLQNHPRGGSVHSTSLLKILLDPDAFGGQIDREPWVERVREGNPPVPE